MRTIQLTVDEADMARQAVRYMMGQYKEAIEAHSTIAESKNVSDETLDAWSHNYQILRKLSDKLV